MLNRLYTVQLGGVTNVKKLLLMGIVVILLSLISGIWPYIKTSYLHRPIKVEDISSMTLWGGHGGHRDATQEEIRNIVNWFNSASKIRANKGFAGETPASGIIIKEINGEEFGIIRSGKDFEVQRKGEFGEVYSYWAIQNEIKTLLDELAQFYGPN